MTQAGSSVAKTCGIKALKEVNGVPDSKRNTIHSMRKEMQKMSHPRNVFIVALTVVPLAAGLAGCGGAKSDTEKINDVARQFATDAKSKNWDGLCSAMSTKARAQLQVAAAFLGSKDCAGTMKAAFALSDDSDKLGKVDPDTVKVTALKITGDHATGKMTGDPTSFIREDGEWKLDADPEDTDKGSSTTSAGSVADDNTSELSAPKLNVAERGFSRIGDQTSYGIVVKNPAADDAVGVEVQTNFIGTDGGVIATETDDLAGVPAGERVNVGGEADTNGEAVRSLDVTITTDSGATAGTVALPKANRVRLSHEDFGGLSVRAQVTNTLDQPLSSISDVFAVLRDGSGDIVGGLSSFPNSDVQPGGRAAVELGGLDDIPGAVSADITVDGETND
jgi:hypothetical protein